MNTTDFKIMIPCQKTLDFVLLEQIIRCEGLQNYTRIFLGNGKSIISSCNIGVYKKALSKFDFFSCHKSHLINKKHILRYHKDGKVEMTDASLVPVSRRKKGDFYKEITKHDDVVAIQLDR